MPDPLFTFSGHEVFRTEDGGLHLRRKGSAASHPIVDDDVVEALLAERDAERQRAEAAEIRVAEAEGHNETLDSLASLIVSAVEAHEGRDEWAADLYRTGVTAWGAERLRRAGKRSGYVASRERAAEVVAALAGESASPPAAPPPSDPLVEWASRYKGREYWSDSPEWELHEELLAKAVAALRASREAADCPTCTTYKGRMAPSHDGSPNCESGSIASGVKNAHCTCDTCF